MRCSICGLRIDSEDNAVEEGWIPYFCGAKSSMRWPVQVEPKLYSKTVRMARWKSKRSSEGG